MPDKKISEALTPQQIFASDRIPMARGGDINAYAISPEMLKAYLNQATPYVNIREGGAHPGNLDNATQINNFLTNIGPDKRVLFDDIYPVLSTINLDRGYHIEGHTARACGLIAGAGFDPTAVSPYILRQVRDGNPAGKDRVYIDHFGLFGNNQACSGLEVELQQPATIRNLVVYDCLDPNYGVGVHVKNTVQASFFNIQINNCHTGLFLDSADLCYFYTLDVEYITQTAVKARGASRWNGIWGFHNEGTSAPDGVIFDISGTCHSWTVDCVYAIAAQNEGGQKVMIWLHNADAGAGDGAFTGNFFNVYADTSPRIWTVVCKDDDRDLNILGSELGGNNINLMFPSHRYGATQAPLLIAGQTGQYAKFGADGVVSV